MEGISGACLPAQVQQPLRFGVASSKRRCPGQFKHLYDFSRNGAVDVIDPAGYRYEILSGTESNLARHGRRMAGELFRMLTS